MCSCLNLRLTDTSGSLIEILSYCVIKNSNASIGDLALIKRLPSQHKALGSVLSSGEKNLMLLSEGI